MPEHHAAGVGIARVVVAGRVGGAGNGATVRVGAGEDVVLIRCVADAIDGGALLVQRGLLVDLIAVPFDVAVQVGDIVRDQRSARVIPGTGAMRSRALTAGWPLAALALRYARHWRPCGVGMLPACAICVQYASAPANPP